MKTSEHITSNQIAAFSAGSLAASDSRTVGGHLIRCGECRSLLPIPDPTQVWTAINREHDFGELQRTRSLTSSKPPYPLTVVGLFGKRNRLAWAGGMLAIVVGLTVLFIFSVSNKQSNETEVARSFQVENSVPTPNPIQTNEMNTVVTSNSESDSDIKTSSISKDREWPKHRRNLPSRTAAMNVRTTSAAGRNIASTRGATEPCGVGGAIEVEIGSNKSDIVLRWKPVPKAARYHLFVSDDNEILVDEFETDRATSYVLKKPLDPAKSYNWKIVITLESGQKLYAEARKFSAKDFQSYFSSYKNKARSNTRCLAN